MIHLNILQQRLRRLRNGLQESCLEAMGKKFQGIYCNCKTCDKCFQSNLSVSVLGRHLDVVCPLNKASILYFVPWEFLRIFVAVHLLSKVIREMESRSLCSHHIFQIQEYTGGRECLYPADIIKSTDTL
jgi:hypothetical protein